MINTNRVIFIYIIKKYTKTGTHRSNSVCWDYTKKKLVTVSKNDSISCWRTCITVTINEQNDDDDFVKIVIKATAVMFDLFPKWDYQWRRKLFFFKWRNDKYM